MAPADPILGLTEAFNKDPNPDKINLGVGVYQDANGTTPILDCVKQAEAVLVNQEKSKSYLGIAGIPEFGRDVQTLLFGAEHPIVSSQRARTLQAPGGTGALRVALDFTHVTYPDARIWLSTPTWANHPAICAAAAVDTDSYPYFDSATNSLDHAGMMQRLAEIPAGDVILLHACCHNPSGIDPTIDQWREIGDVASQRGLLPLVDFAYQGFGDGLEQDAAGLLELCKRCDELLIASSFSKNFGLYRERTGALTVIGKSAEQAERVLSHLKRCVRANYSNPPAHGAAIVTTVLADPSLRRQWEGELSDMRQRISGMRELFVEHIAAQGVDRDFSFIQRQRGMFSFSGLTAEQVDRLREEHSIYIVRSGRINVAGITPQNVERLCAAVAGVL
jgi:aspartate/tyrosine/aromatic aminotransferase